MIWRTLAFLVVFTFSCSNLGVLAQTIEEKTVDPAAHPIQPAKIGTAENVHFAGNLFFSGQFAPDDIAELKKLEISRVITLRTDGEIKWDEKTAIEDAEIEFVQIPFRAPESLTDEVFDKVRAALNDKSKTTLFHCGSANRVGGVWLAHRVLDEGVELETALAEAKTIGLRTAFIEEKALDYIKRNQVTPGLPAMAGEKSVKPGINQRFIDPELDVDAFVKRFEIESREVYVARQTILAACGIEQGDVVADVGAGTGLFTRLFSAAVGEMGWVYAVDIAPRFIEHINQEAGKQKLENITGVLCAENSINLPPNSVDTVFVCDTYHHFEYPKSTLASIHRALKDGGRLIVIDFERIPGKSREWLIGHVRAGKEVFRAEVMDAGFTLVDEPKIEGFKENYFLKFRKN